MKSLKSISAIAAALTLATLLGCAATSTRESTGEYVDDSVITTKVKAAFAAASDVKATEVNVETFKGVVQLSGFISSDTNSTRAVELARGVKGVKSVKNDMRVK